MYFLSFFKDLFYYFKLCVMEVFGVECGYVHMSVVHRVWETVSDLMDLELQGLVSCPTWALGLKSTS